jgi:glucan phosphoethanolaminetransferase (alkaline phosphatase superfamily)
LKKKAFTKILTGFINNPTQILLLFIFVNLIPSFGLIFTEPFDIWGRVTLLLFPAGLYSIIYSISKNTGLMQLVLIPLLVLHAFQIVVFYLFGEGVIAVDMFLNVATTNVSEAEEVLQSILASVVFVVVVYVPVIIIAAMAYKRKLRITNRLRKKCLLVGIVLLAGSLALSKIARNENTGTFVIYEDVYPADVLYNLKLALQKWHRSSRYPETSKDFTFGAKKEAIFEFGPCELADGVFSFGGKRKVKPAEREIIVLVVGETSRAENWGLYGYRRNTTPKLSADSNLVVFDDVVTQSNATHKSVPIILSAASAEDFSVIYKQKSIIEAFKETGYTTVFISNQSANRTFTDYFAQEADYLDYYRSSNESTNNFDGVMLPKFKHYIDSIHGNMFIILHTYGSHFNYKERYPKNFSVFTPDNVTKISREEKDVLVNAYDNTILYTDNFLHSVITLLKESKACASMFYVSDHGEDILDDDRLRFLHASPNPTFYQLRIPMLIWFSEIYKADFPSLVKNAFGNKSLPISTNAVFHTVLDMAHIETAYKDSNKSLVSSRLKVSPRMYLDDHDKPILFYNAGLKKYDKDMIAKRKMKH